MSKRANPEINAGSMADIAFLLLIFYLVTTTMNVDAGIMRNLPDPKADQTERQVKKRNVLFVSINSRDQILVNLEEKIEVADLKDRARKFILNTNDDPTMPEVVVQEIEGIGRIRTTKATVSLQNTPGTSYEIYVKVQNELTRAFNEVRDEVALRYFQKPYDKLEKEEQDAVRKAVPLSISEAEPKI